MVRSLSEVPALISPDADQYRISASIDINDRDAVDRLADRLGAMFCIDAIEVRGECPCPTQTHT
jgi:hypothetical protein